MYACMQILWASWSLFDSVFRSAGAWLQSGLKVVLTLGHDWPQGRRKWQSLTSMDASGMAMWVKPSTRWLFLTSLDAPGLAMWLKPSKYKCFAASQLQPKNLGPCPEEAKVGVLGPTLTACPTPISPTSSFLCFQNTASQPGRPQGAGGFGS